MTDDVQEMLDRMGISWDRLRAAQELAIQACAQIWETISRKMAELRDLYPWWFAPHYWAGLPVEAGTRIVKPAKGGKTFFGWRDDRWAPVHRVKGVGWVWSA